MRSLSEVAKEIGESEQDLLVAQNSIAIVHPKLSRVEGVSFYHHQLMLICKNCGHSYYEHTIDLPEDSTCLEDADEVPNTMFWLMLSKEHHWTVEHLKETIF